MRILPRITAPASGPASLRLLVPPIVPAVATSACSRAVGLLGTPDLRGDEGLVLVPCASVHGIGLRCRIGVAFVDRRGIVMRVVDPLPWWGARCRGAFAVVEVAAGLLADVRAGDTLLQGVEHIFPLRGNSAA